MRLANFNLFIPCLILALFVFSQLLMIPMMLIFGFLAKLGILSQKGLFTSPWQFYLPHLLTFALVTYIFLKRDISPVTRKPTHENRYQIGQKLIGIMNIIAAVTIILPIIISKLSNNSENMLYMYFAIPVLGIGLCVWLVGLYMVLSSKA